MTEAEKAAVSLALDFFERGPVAWQESLSSTHPLRQLLPYEALDEIAVRLGSSRGATWELRTPGPRYDDGTVIFSIEFPSGHDEAILIHLVEEDGWKIDTLRSLEDPTPADSTLDILLSRPVAIDRENLRVATQPLGILTLLVAALFLGLTGRGRDTRRGIPGDPRRSKAWVLLGAGCFGLALTLSACRANPEAEAIEGENKDAETIVRLGELLPLRDALTGESEEDLEALFAAAPTEGAIGDVVKSWRAVQLMNELRLDEVTTVLGTLEEETPLPIADLARARLAFLRGDVVETPKLFDLALTRGIDHDGLRLEAAGLYGYMGIEGGAEILYTQLGEMGSRDAEAYYNLAKLAALSDKRDLGEAYFKIGWSLSPVEREELFDDPLLAWLCTRDSLFSVLQLDRVEEPAVTAPQKGEAPIDLPVAAEAFLSGDVLRIDLNDADLIVFGGGILAPDEAIVETADAVTRRERLEALAELPALAKIVRSGVINRPAARQEVLSAANALVEARRWHDLLELTEGLVVEGRRTDPLLGQMRARALSETNREAEATHLLISVAQGNLGNKLTAPYMLYQLAEIFVAREEFELAERLLVKAQAVAGQNVAGARIRQVRMMKRLADDSGTYQSRHFEIRYPRRTGERYAAQIANVLEEEFKRISRWIPSQGVETIDVDLFPLEEFMDSYSGGVSVLGIYDGRVRVPFADLRSLHPMLISILSHELAHAMIDQRTGDQAPSWFHEGLAQHIEMVQNDVNPVPDLYATSRVLTLPVVQSILGGFAEPQFVSLSYGQAAWTVHYIEAKHGVKGIHRMLEAFSRGEDTEAALQSTFGHTVSEFDREFWTWSVEKAPTMWPATLRRYDEEAHLAEVTAPAQRRVITRAAGNSNQRAMQGGPRDDAMKSWHATYSARIAPIRSQLAPIIRFVREGQSSPEIAKACNKLSSDLRSLLQEGTLESVDPNVSRKLKGAFRAFEAMAIACGRGQNSVMTTELDRGEQQLGSAARSLQRYGLRP
ncbi:MAG: hypothetical protein K8J08_07475 [Thermoanaerobaculia bacterium]|nr:hypothetical protein [Thermoanaerobaculia bacterium]